MSRRGLCIHSDEMRELDIGSPAKLAGMPTSGKIVRGVASSPDGCFAYISCQSVGAGGA
jgi:hypothetical protein